MWLVLQNNAGLVPLVGMVASLVLDGEWRTNRLVIKVICPLTPPLLIHLPLHGQGPLPVLLGDNPVLG